MLLVVSASTSMMIVAEETEGVGGDKAGRVAGVASGESHTTVWGGKKGTYATEHLANFSTAF